MATTFGRAPARLLGEQVDRRARRRGATTSKRSGSAAMTSSVCVPIEPVDPAIDDARHRRGLTECEHEAYGSGDGRRA